MAEGEIELPEFPDSIPTSIGSEMALGGTENVCLSFCIFWWNGVRWVPWKSLSFCAPSMEEIQSLVDFWLQKLTTMGFQCRAQQGNCPAS